MHKIEDTVCTERNRHNPERRPEAEYGCGEEDSSDQRLEHERAC